MKTCKLLVKVAEIKWWTSRMYEPLNAGSEAVNSYSLFSIIMHHFDCNNLIEPSYICRSKYFTHLVFYMYVYWKHSYSAIALHIEKCITCFEPEIAFCGLIFRVADELFIKLIAWIQHSEKWHCYRHPNVRPSTEYNCLHEKKNCLTTEFPNVTCQFTM